MSLKCKVVDGIIALEHYEHFVCLNFLYIPGFIMLQHGPYLYDSDTTWIDFDDTSSLNYISNYHKDTILIVTLVLET